jgi:hypothetical protein
MIIKRLYVVSSPHNALACLAMIEQDKITHPDNTYEDYGVLWCLTPYDYGKSVNIRIATLKILNIHNFVKIMDLTGYDIDLKKSFNDNPNLCINQIHEHIGISFFDESYHVRNCYGYDVLPLAYQTGKVIIYGETYHKIDSCMGSSYSKIDIFRLPLPVDLSNGLLNFVPLKIVPKESFLCAIGNYFKKYEEDKKEIESLYKTLTENNAILTIQYLSEVKDMALRDEISMYVNMVKYTCDKKTTIIIKGHPRSLNIQKVIMIKSSLESEGYKEILILPNKFQYMPIELICYIFKPNKVISTSTSLLILKYLYGINGIFCLNKLSSNYFKTEYNLTLYKIVESAMENLESWDNKTPLFTYSGLPIYTLYGRRNELLTLHDRIRDSAHDLTAIYHELTEKVMRNISSKRKSITDMMNWYNFKKIAIYGVDGIGKIIIDDILISKQKIDLYLVDSHYKEREYRDLIVYRLYDLEVMVDAVVVTAMHHYNDICRDILLSSLGRNMIYSFAELVENYLPEYH